MAFEQAREYLRQRGYAERITVFQTSSATVELAAQAIGTEPERIAKSLTFWGTDAPIMIVCAGDGRVDNKKFKEQFGRKAKMLTKEEVAEEIGHDVGGVCPFGIREGVKVYLDVSMKRFDRIYPACGSSNSMVDLTPEELETLCEGTAWVDICKF
ncbi:YbaK/EbsC family protein [Clostridiaceae bacterium 68-1-5]|uniref:YbaK/EbsC family protein n=1 Tax=Suipraeoptans intestinalis TaxID=2606628 RepID=A0A6N7USC8_9FIRM|nr:YbaK/EbsC family protein [Suipraeoptans intestinalis]MSR93811.1 YbaK/EbsC family protein [Suipraeoptans intestinalis]